MTDLADLPPGFQLLLEKIREQPPHVRELFRYALVLALIDDEKARMIGTPVEEEREWLSVETVAGDVFEIARPPISEDVKAELMRQVRAIVANKDVDGS